MCYIKFHQGNKGQTTKIDEDLKNSASELTLDPSTNSNNFVKVISLIDLHVELIREETKIGASLTYIQSMMLPHTDVMQKYLAYANKLVHDTNFLVIDLVMELST